MTSAMNKHLLTITLFFLFLKIAWSQNISSLANGNWTNPSIWSCNCVPSTGSNITISHQITLNTNYTYSSGSLTINSSGLLNDGHLGKTLSLTGGTLNNNGTIDILKLITQTGFFYNYGTIKANIYLNSINFYNSGNFIQIDSITNNALITNNGFFTSINKISNNGIFNNNKQAFFLRLTNNGTFNNNNYLEIEVLNNKGSFTNRDSTTSTSNIYNQGIINNEAGGNIEVEKKLLNKSSLNTKANIINNGSIQTIENLTNYDTLSGTIGYYDIQDTTINYGTMTGNFSLCDHTPPATSPYIDSNSGIVDNNINWCILTGNTNTENKNIISIYPNPASSQLFINYKDNKKITIYIYDGLGNVIGTHQNQSIINTSNYANGMYMIFANEGNQVLQQLKIIILK